MSGNLPPSCRKCPSMIEGNAAVQQFGKSLGAPVCGRYGHVLGKPGLEPKVQDRLLQHMAGKCDAFGDPLPVGAPQSRTHSVALPDVDRRENIDEGLKDLCSSCATCKNYISPDKVAAGFGWTEGMCAAKGNLLLGNRLAYEARYCEYRQFGKSTVTSTAGINLLPEYENAFQTNADPIRAYFKSQQNFVDPADYPTDQPVELVDQEKGIRAWRKVIDPAGSGNAAFLPIYDREFFEPEERKKIPLTGEDEHPELYVDHFGGVYLAAVAWTELDETPAAWGEAGVGKTELYRHLAWLMCIPFYRVTITASTEVDDLIGKMHFNPEEGTHFEYGRLPLAWQKPCVLVLDEPNVGPVEVWQAVRPLTDNSKQLVIDQNKGEIIDRHTDCYFGMAMNPAWDVKNIGANPIGDADASRLFHVFVEPPPEELEREIIKNRVELDGWEIDAPTLDMVMRIAIDLRGLIANGEISQFTWGIRPQIKVARALRWFEPYTAYHRAIGDFLEPEAKVMLDDVIKNHVAS